MLFSTTVYPVLERHCSECHASDTALKQQPFFAEGPPSDADAIELAYEAAKSKMNLDDPSISRFVLRLRNEFHNCWTQSCANDANAMQAAIQQFSNGVTPTAVDPELVHEQGHDALRRHDRVGRQPLRSERHRAL